MICLKSATINELISKGYPTDTIVYWVDMRDNSKVSDTYQKYLDKAYKLFGIEKELINGRTRLADVCEVRQLIWCVMRFNDGFSTSMIGQMARRNHATIITRTNALMERMKVDKLLKKKYDVFCNSINKDVEDFDKKFENG